jgi:hypothetical protein
MISPATLIDKGVKHGMVQKPSDDDQAVHRIYGRRTDDGDDRPE